MSYQCATHHLRPLARLASKHPTTGLRSTSRCTLFAPTILSMPWRLFFLHLRRTLSGHAHMGPVLPFNIPRTRPLLKSRTQSLARGRLQPYHSIECQLQCLTRCFWSFYGNDGRLLKWDASAFLGGVVAIVDEYSAIV